MRGLAAMADSGNAPDAKECPMPIACTLGLAACLKFADQEFRAEDAVSILGTCHEIPSLDIATFRAQQPTGYSDIRRAAMAGRGYAVGEELERRGLKIDWPREPGPRKGAWLITCHRFEQAFNDKRLWKHLDRWPK